MNKENTQTINCEKCGHPQDATELRSQLVRLMGQANKGKKHKVYAPKRQKTDEELAAMPEEQRKSILYFRERRKKIAENRLLSEK